jgi:thymidylate synthase
MGVNIPSDASRVWSAAKNGYYSANRNLNRLFGLDRTNSNNSNAWNNNKAAQSKYVKLSELLDKQWPEIKKYYEKYNQGYTISRVCPAAENAKKTIEQIVQLVQQIKNNAQGTNP